MKCRTCGTEIVTNKNATKYCSDICHFWMYASVGEKNECWIWTGPKSNFGHGSFISGYSGHVQAHRISWEIHRGKIPEGLCVCHDCPGGDNPACVNPEHLWLGTKAENSRDRDEKGRHVALYGENANGAKLTEENVSEIRRRAKLGEPCARMDKEFSISPGYAWRIVNRKSWNHVR